MNVVQIQVGNTKTGAKFLFKCGRWLSLKEDDRSIIKELPAFGEGVQPQQGLSFSCLCPASTRFVIQLFVSVGFSLSC
jgi:hypothetical protein